MQVSEIAKFEMILLTAHLAAKAPRMESLDPNRRLSPGQWLYQKLVRELLVPLLPLIPVVLLLVMEPHMSGIVLTCAIVGTILLLGGNGGGLTWAGAFCCRGAAGIGSAAPSTPSPTCKVVWTAGPRT